jgi:DNA-binding MarR family transcriptional regulator
MTGTGDTSDEDAAAATSLYDVAANDPDGSLIGAHDAGPAEVAQINEVMRALGALRDAEEAIAQAALEFMRLGRTDMRALHFLIVSENRGETATAGAIATHLHISSASTTKLLDRLERGGHITRSPHPTDRRSLVIRITPETRTAAIETVGAQQARRFHAAARLTAEERETVVRFLRDMTAEISAPRTPAPPENPSPTEESTP